MQNILQAQLKNYTYITTLTNQYYQNWHQHLGTSLKMIQVLWCQ